MEVKTNWTYWYISVIGALLLEVVLFYLFTQYFA